MQYISVKDIFLLFTAPVIAIIFGWILSLFKFCWSYFSIKNTRSQYNDFLIVLNNKDHLILLLLEGIGKCIVAITLNFSIIFITFLPLFSEYSYASRYFFVTGLTFYMFILIGISLSKPLDLCWALRNQGKYIAQVTKKLGKLPVQSSPSYSRC